MTNRSISESKTPRILVLGAHPDDAEFHAGGLLAAHVRRGSTVKLISVTNGAAGHHRLDPLTLAVTRREEARRAGEVLGVTYETWDFPDARLVPSLEVRERIIREIRSFHPDLVLTHRPHDYHPDHRAVGLAVQDASYLVTVPLVAPDTPHLEKDPVVAYMCDLFTKPYPLQPQVVLDVTEFLPLIVQMLACHESQVFDFLPYNQGIAETVPQDPEERMAWLTRWFLGLTEARADRFRAELRARYGDSAEQCRLAEAYEISEYAGQLSADQRDWLFPETRGEHVAQ